MPTPISIAAVIPAYRVRAQVAAVIRAMPSVVDLIFVVDDACPEGSGEAARAVGDPRVRIIRHERNGGVGAATTTGLAAALEAGCRIAVKVDGDGQMDPADLVHLLEPILNEQAACTKGNRFWHLERLGRMPVVRRLGNMALSFLVKVASGHWQLFDPTNGYIALRTDVFEVLDKKRLANRYFFEISLLIELGKRGFRVADVPLPARYGGEQSSLSILRTLFTFPWLLALGAVRRISYRHFWFEFTPAAAFISLGLPLFCWGVAFGVHEWLRSTATSHPATAGTVMLAALPFGLGVVLLLQALAMEVGGAFATRVGIRALMPHPILQRAPTQDSRSPSLEPEA